MGQSIVQVDAFTDRLFAGNPACVCVLDAPADAAWMQDVAKEMNLSETAFLHREGDGFCLRWFTPMAEVDLCGHATLASAHVLWRDGYLAAREQVCFHTLSGLLTADQRDGWIELDFPAEPASGVAPPEGLIEALGVAPVNVGRNRLDYLVEVTDERAVCNARPDMGRLAVIPTRGVIVTSRADADGFDVVSRFSAPAVGVPEDPVTGSAHCCLGPYWADRLGKRELTCSQASARGGTVRVRLAGDRVKLLGQAVTVLRGELASAP